MNYMTTAEIREKYLAFFEEKGCKRMPSSSLIPDDPSLLLTSAGMVQFKPYFLHQKELDSRYIGATTAQKCVRTNDIDNIGDARHLSFFEMLGDFSFGGVSKQQACAWAFELITKEFKLPLDRLYFTVFTEDDETHDVWRSLGVAEDHISRLGEDDNFWAAGPTGPCGPCSEIFYDHGPSVQGGPPGSPDEDGDRYMEIWNLVFMQFNRKANGSLEPLAANCIDTGMGFERLCMILQGKKSNYDTDVFQPTIQRIAAMSGKTYGADEKCDVAMRVVADLPGLQRALHLPSGGRSGRSDGRAVPRA